MWTQSGILQWAHTLSTGASTIIFTSGASVKQTGQQLQVQKVAYNTASTLKWNFKCVMAKHAKRDTKLGHVSLFCEMANLDESKNLINSKSV